MSAYDLGRDVVDQVRRAADIVSVVGEQVSLRKMGKNYVGLCPFHGERTPSFYVSPDKGTFYCFGCRKGGSVFDFVMETQHLSFAEAVVSLAKRFGVALPVASAASRQRSAFAERVSQALEAAQAFFLSHLGLDRPRAFLESRGITFAEAQELGLGFAPAGWRNLCEELQKKGFSEQVLQGAGLVVQGEQGRLWDRFRDRITIPIRTFRGQLIAFGGRAVGDGQPKYLNSPETALFSKSKVLFGGERAAKAMAAQGEAILVEGYFDCLTLQLAGFFNTVATLGTALSESHVRELAQRVQRVYLCYDGDPAGRQASEAALPLLLAADLEVAVVQLPAELDPDLLVRRHGADAFRRLLAQAAGPAEFLLQQAGDSLPARRRQVGRALAIIDRCPNPARRYALKEELARGVGIPVEQLTPLPLPRSQVSTEGPNPPAGELALLRALLVDLPEVARGAWLAQIPAEEIQHPLCRQVVEVLLSCAAAGMPLEISRVSTHINEREARRLVAALEHEVPPTNQEGLEKILRELWERQKKRQLATLSQEIRRAHAEQDQEALARALAEMQLLLRQPGGPGTGGNRGV
ncbi:MAG: DNA primase [Thermoanaerobaculum sp.]|nr:DNA primase [Thermoanaerobaculum sp.]MDW7968524.1 DNA primase [Thermoanaerobaculum sp.]